MSDYLKNQFDEFENQNENNASENEAIHMRISQAPPSLSDPLKQVPLLSPQLRLNPRRQPRLPLPMKKAPMSGTPIRHSRPTANIIIPM